MYIYKKNNNRKRTSKDDEVNKTNMTTKKITQNSSISSTNLSNDTFISYRQAYVLLGWLNLQNLEFDGPENFKARNLKDWILADQIARVDFDGPAFWRTKS